MWTASHLKRPILLEACLLIVTLLVPAAATASTGSLILDRLEKHSVDDRQARFNFVVRELLMSIAPTPAYPVASLGLFEFDATIENRITFYTTNPRGTDTDSAWTEMAESGDAQKFQVIPGFRVRKGLPYSFEVGTHVALLVGTRQWTLGGYGRWVLQDGWKWIPDFAIQIGYTGYVGNDQIEAGVLDLDFSVGHTFETEGSVNRVGRHFSPFLGYSLLMAHARPLSTTVEGIQPVTAFQSDVEAGVDARDLQFHRVFLGLAIESAAFTFRVAGGAAFPRKMPVSGYVDLAVGLKI